MECPKRTLPMFRRARAVSSQLSRRRVGERLGKKPAALGWFGNCAKHNDDLARFSQIVFLMKMFLFVQ